MSTKGDPRASGSVYNHEDEEEQELQDDELDDGAEIEEEIEVEATDDEEEELAVSTPQKKGTPNQKEDKGKKPMNTAGTPASSSKKQPVQTIKQGTPGGVMPSDKVKNMKISSPQSSKARADSTLTPDKNPFTNVRSWSPANISQIEIVFPMLTPKNESTNALTRSSRPEARYWKAPIVFKFGNFTSDTMRFDNVHIPFHTGKDYGSNYVYLCLPGHVGKSFDDAGKSRAPTKVVEASLIPDGQRWWKIANNVQEHFGIVNQETKMFHKKSLETIFDSTSAGISCSVILRFYCKASTTDINNIRPITVRTVSVEVVRTFITQIDINVQIPIRINREKTKVEPVTTAADVATDDLMKRLTDLGM